MLEAEAVLEDAHDPEADVEPDEVGELERPHRMVQPDSRTGIDVLGAPDALLVGAHRLHEERHEDAIHDEPGPVGGHDDLLAELGRQGADGLHRLVGGGLAADELDERHDRDRAEEMHPDEPRPPRPGSTASASRWIAIELVFEAKIARRRRVPVELPPQLGLDRQVLEDRLDDEVGARPRLGVGGRLDPGQRRLALVGRERPLSTARWRLPRCARVPASARARSGSYSTTCLPMAAWTWAMPWPISPAPATKTRSIVIAGSVPGRPHHGRWTSVPAHGRGARPRRRQDAPRRRTWPPNPIDAATIPRMAGDESEREVDERRRRPDDRAALGLVDARHRERQQGREEEGDPGREDGRADVDPDRTGDEADARQPDGGSHERGARQTGRADLVGQLGEDDPQHDTTRAYSASGSPAPSIPSSVV